MQQNNQPNPNTTISFAYDGGCPLCAKTAAHICDMQQDQNINAIDARDQHNHIFLSDIATQELELNTGMVIFDGTHYHHGAAAIYYIVMHMPYKKAHLLYWLTLPLRSLFFCRLIYPLFRFMRFCLLKWKGLPPLPSPTQKEET